MFGDETYLGYTLIFTMPPLIIIWLRREFFDILVKRACSIFAATTLLTLYGSIVWPIALSYDAWGYSSERILGIKLFHFVYIEDMLWWALISFLFASFITVSRYYEDRGINIVTRELRALFKSFDVAFGGFRALTLERNTTIHSAVALFVILQGIFFRISLGEWVMIIFAIGMVVGVELLNNAIERLADVYTRRHNERVRLLKDTAAAGVLVASVATAFIGIAIFLPRIIMVLT